MGNMCCFCYFNIPSPCCDNTLLICWRSAHCHHEPSWWDCQTVDQSAREWVGTCSPSLSLLAKTNQMEASGIWPMDRTWLEWSLSFTASRTSSLSCLGLWSSGGLWFLSYSSNKFSFFQIRFHCLRTKSTHWFSTMSLSPPPPPSFFFLLKILYFFKLSLIF